MADARARLAPALSSWAPAIAIAALAFGTLASLINRHPVPDFDIYALGNLDTLRFVLFDNDTRLAFITSFDGPWDSYMEDFFTSGTTLQLFDAAFQYVEGYSGLPDLAAVKSFILSGQVTGAAYARNYGGTVKEIRKAQLVNAAFQQVLENPAAAEALQHPALKPLLDVAAD